MQLLTGQCGHVIGARQEEAPQYSAATLRSLGNVDESLINYDLLEALMCHVMATQQPSSGASAILVFLPGAPEISRLVRQLQVHPWAPPLSSTLGVNLMKSIA